MILLQIDNTNDRVVNVGQPPWANQDDFLDSSIVEVESVPFTPEQPYYDWLYVDGQYVYNYLLTPQRQKEIHIADVLDRLNMSALADMTPAEIYTAMQNKMNAWANLGQAKADLMEWLPLMAAVIFWKVK